LADDAIPASATFRGSSVRTSPLSKAPACSILSISQLAFSPNQAAQFMSEDV
jgi:hypothetical protein